MKIVIRRIGFLMITFIGIILWNGICYSQLSSGQIAPAFSLKDLKGQTHDLSQAKERPLLVLYFFDVDSRPSQEGLLSLNRLAKQHKGSDLAVWAITRSPKEKVIGFVENTGLEFPVLLDGTNVSNLYHARTVLPAVCIIGPGLKILNYYQGGGKTTETMLVSVAERKLQQKQVVLAKAISDEIIKKYPDNVKARTVKGYAALKESNLKEAEEIFKDVSRKSGHDEVLGKEGLAAVYARKDQQEKALALADEVAGKAPERAYAHVIKGDVLYAQNKKKEAEAEYQKAVRKDAEPFQSAVKYNQLGRLYANSGQYKKARELYDEALTIDPYYIEGTTNKGVTYEKEGKWDKALESYRQALAFDKNDAFASVLAKKAQEMMDLQKDIERNKRVNQLVKDLAARFQKQKETASQSEDVWTSQPMVLSFVDFQEKGGLAERDGFSSVLMSQLADNLNASGRVKVVERVLIERLLEELNLGSSDLANPETALKLGKVLAAKLIGTGSLLYMPQGTMLSLRLIDTETSAIPQVTNRQFDTGESLEKGLFQLNREILKTVITKYPLRGYLAKLTGDQAVINLGSNQGVVTGTKFDVLEEQESIQYKGKALQSSPKPIAQVEVVRVEPGMSFCKVLKQARPLKVDDKVQEKIEEIVLK
jgi:tetratricopeptide (TPR) repeat protein/peroxiredoxin